MDSPHFFFDLSLSPLPLWDSAPLSPPFVFLLFFLCSTSPPQALLNLPGVHGVIKNLRIYARCLALAITTFRTPNTHVKEVGSSLIYVTI